MKLFPEPNYQVHYEFNETGNVVKRALELSTNKTLTTEKALNDIYRNGLYEFLKFSWFSFLIYPSNTNPHLMIHELKLLYDYFYAHNFAITLYPDKVLVSGSGYNFYNLITDNSPEYEDIVKAFRKYFYHRTEAVKSNYVYPEQQKFAIVPVTKYQIEQTEPELSKDCLITSEVARKKHNWLAIELNNVSRLFLLNFLHLPLTVVYNQTKNKPQMDFEIVLDQNTALKNKVDMDKIEESMSFLQKAYNFLLGRGHKRDVIEYILPQGLATTCLICGTYEQWEQAFNMTHSHNAYGLSNWETTFILNDIMTKVFSNYK